jgi:CheY-like chemotaxis protein
MYKLFLLADDDHDDAELFAEALQSIDKSVTFRHVEDGQAVFSLLNTMETKPDIIFLDLNMPAMNGWQCLTKLKGDESLKHIPVIMYSTSSNPRDKEIARELGAHGFITKPSDFKLLKQMLSDITENHGTDLGTILDRIKTYTSSFSTYIYKLITPSFKAFNLNIRP